MNSRETYFVWNVIPEYLDEAGSILDSNLYRMVGSAVDVWATSLLHNSADEEIERYDLKFKADPELARIYFWHLVLSSSTLAVREALGPMWEALVLFDNPRYSEFGELLNEAAERGW
jgi:hypothetical protein